jgi:hypothetical protein
MYMPPDIIGTAALSHGHGTVGATGNVLRVNTGTAAIAHGHGSVAATGAYVAPRGVGTAALSHGHGSASGIGRIAPDEPTLSSYIPLEAFGPLTHGRNAKPASGVGRLMKRHGGAAGTATLVAPAIATGGSFRTPGRASAVATMERPYTGAVHISRSPGKVGAEGTFEDTEAIEMLLMFHSIA